ncbi:potassium channel family protein [Ammoniphilus sp. 3BR4]|uniref:potassium channel family protein n=1 Tax=Ammoniphilus sp. 3BR4 TaxID=3158265 RepID=UPI00346571A4
MNRRKVLFYNLVALFLFYLNIVISFALVYTALDLTQLGPIVDHYATPNHQEQWVDRLTRSLYFSAITLLSVGYGDVTPFGWSKAVAIIEALIGYILPTALVFKYVLLPASPIRRVFQQVSRIDKK